MKQRVLVAMSGGVDSSVVAALLKKQGNDVIGCFLKFWHPTQNHTKQNPDSRTKFTTGRDTNQHISENICCNQEALRLARSVADQLKIPFYVLDVSKEFKREVVDYYISEYDSGRTPNPCVVCNKKIKFGWLLEKAKELGCEYLATGHYAQSSVIPDRKRSASGQESRNTICIDSVSCFVDKSRIKYGTGSVRNDTIQLYKPKDVKKDQTYFLWQLSQDQLKYILFPIGQYQKSEVRKLAREFKLPVAEKKESQNVCFVPDGDNKEFLKQYAKKLTKSGNIVDKKGSILGKHGGLYQYTIGQRQGLPQLDFSKSQLAYDKTRPPKVFVIELNVDKNQLVVGLEKDLYSKELVAEEVNWIDPHIAYRLSQGEKIKCKAKIRYGHNAERCKVYRGKGVKVIFDKSQRAITPGQSVVFYKEDELVGGGIIR